MSTLPDDAILKHQPTRIEGELPGLSGEPHVRLAVPAREQSTLESLSSAFRGLGSMSMTRASTQPLRTTTYASFSPTSPTFTNNLMLSDDDGGSDEAFYGNRLSIDIPGNEHIVWSGWDQVWWNGQNTPSRLLLLGYRGGVQVWDCTHEQVREVLNLISPTIGGTVIGATVIPASVSSQDDLLSEERPLVGILTSRPDELIIYSLRTHATLKRLPFNSPQAIQASDQFIVISTVAPPALHILDSVTFDHLSTISAPHVALPVFALSRRVLAYASTPPPPSASPTPTPSAASPSKVQADISMAIEGARKVGVGVWSGVKSLLRESNTPRPSSTCSPTVRSPIPMSPPMLGSPRIYSRSAPSESSYSTGSLPRVTVSASGEPRPTTSQGHVTVVDLEPLLSGGQAPRKIVQHHATPGQAVSLLSFSRTGNLLAVTGADGIFVRIFEVRPKGRYSKGGPRFTKRDELNELEERDTGSLWHWYDLQRGLTRRRVTNIVWSADSKWVTVITVRGTLHIFAVNPYGGIPSGASHLLGSGRIANMTEPPRAPVSLSPVLRIHMSSSVVTADNQPQRGVPVTAIFGRPSKPDGESGAQDIFVLNQATGELMLKQCIVRMQSASAIERSMQASISLPSALSNSVAGSGVSALSSMMRGGVGAVVGEKPGDELVLGGMEAAARTWGIVKREREWGEVRKAIEKARIEEKSSKKTKSSQSEWLSQAEISTCTRSLKLLTSPIYLSHQFAFFSLCQDWQTPLQQAHLNLPATKITVRREVSARPITDSGSDGTFLGSGTDEMFAATSSLNAPLASALSGSLSPTSTAQQIPSFPNAYSGSKGTSWNDPMRRLSRLSDGLGQGLGSLKREIGKVRPSSGSGERRIRSPKSPPAIVETTPGIKLEFDDDALFEVDEDLPPGDVDKPAQSGELRPLREDDGSRSAESGSGSVPSTVPDMTMLESPELTGDWPGEGDSFGGEEEEYIQAREEDSRFDDLVVGLMDEEEEERRVIMENAASMKKYRKKR